MNTDKIYAQSIAKEYAPNEGAKVVALRKLDKKAKQPAVIFAFTLGVISALLLGVGMCLCMGQIGDGTAISTAAGIAVGIIGIIGLSINYPVYKKLLKKGKEKYAFEIVELAKEIGNDED